MNKYLCYDNEKSAIDFAVEIEAENSMTAVTEYAEQRFYDGMVDGEELTVMVQMVGGTGKWRKYDVDVERVVSFSAVRVE